jgi:hypothetical protein
MKKSRKKEDKKEESRKGNEFPIMVNAWARLCKLLQK